MSETAILILAAGVSSRMGKPKQLLSYKHTTLLGWSIEQAQASKIDEVVCVLGANAEMILESIKKYTIKTIYNPNYQEGLGSSIASGIKELQDKKAVVIMLADQPNVTPVFLNKLLELSYKNPTKMIASSYGSSVGVPALFPKKYYTELVKLKGDKGAKKLLIREIANMIKVHDVDLVDIDSPEDYHKIKQ